MGAIVNIKTKEGGTNYEFNYEFDIAKDGEDFKKDLEKSFKKEDKKGKTITIKKTKDIKPKVKKAKQYNYYGENYGN